MVKYKIVFTKEADKDKKLLKSVGLDRKTRTLLNIIAENPFQNPPPYEKLVGNMSRIYSRRINIQHRLVYEVIENTEGLVNRETIPYVGIVKVLRMWTHYE